MKASPRMQKYFDTIESDVKDMYAYATKARKQGFDPSEQVDIKIAKNLAERVVGLISVVAPKIDGSGVVERIIELEKIYGNLDWRVAMVIAHEIAQQKFVKFETPHLAIEIGIRVGFAYVTVGVVSSPLEGFTSIDVKKRRDGKGEYFCMNFAGPIRNAGGTAAAVSVLIADYVRNKLGYAAYDPDERECERCHVELMDYHERVTNLQYVPSKEEVLFLVKNCPIEIGGDASEKFEVSNFKDLPRVKQNRIRSGFCLIHSSCIPLKAKKLWKQISKWKSDMGMEEWSFMEEFLDIQKRATSKSGTKEEVKKDQTLEEKNIYPIYTYIADLVGGRPVIGHPIRPGGLRLRYGRSRTSGFSAQSVHPATMYVMDDFVAIATQFKVERPGKAAAFTSCDSIMGPTVLLTDGSVEYIDDVKRAKEVSPRVKKILHLGDVLVNYGDFFDRASTLYPPGYCEEWWALEFKKAIDEKGDSLEAVSKQIEMPVDQLEALFVNPMKTKLSLFSVFAISKKYKNPLHPKVTAFWKLIEPTDFRALLDALTRSKVIADENGRHKLVVPFDEHVKRALEVSGVPHTLSAKEFIVLNRVWTHVMFECLGVSDVSEINARIVEYKDENPLVFLQSVSVVTLRDKSGMYIGARMGRPEKAKMRKMAGSPYKVPPQEIRIKQEDGTEQTKVITEHQMKERLREKYEINANKDGTIRYDGSEVPITHFKPKEIRAPISRLKKLGYTHDIHGKPLENDNQVCELFVQDVVLPCCTESPFEPADEVLFRVANYVDELLRTLYGLEGYYNLKTKKDLIGQYVFGLAPHTSAATTGRIVGFTKSQGMFCHPMFHAAMRRDCFNYETHIPIKHKGKWSLQPLGSIVEELKPTTNVDAHGTLECSPKGYTTLGSVDGKIKEVPINNFTKHTNQKMITVTTKLGRKLTTTANHKHITSSGIKLAKNLKIGDVCKLPYTTSIKERDIKELNLIELFKNDEWTMVHGLKENCSLRAELKKVGLEGKAATNYISRDSVPIEYAYKIIKNKNLNISDLKISAKRDSVYLPSVITLSDDLLKLFGLYVAEGHGRKKTTEKGFYQCYVAASKPEIHAFVEDVMKSHFGLKKAENKTDRITYSSKILYYLFIKKLKFGTGAYTKRIPSIFLNLPLARVGKVLTGYFEGDGSVSKTDLRLTFDTVSKGLLQDIQFIFSRMGVFVKQVTYTSKPGPQVRAFYEKKGRDIPSFTLVKGTIQSAFVAKASKYVEFISAEKRERHEYVLKQKTPTKLAITYDGTFVYDEIVSISKEKDAISYCLNVENNTVVANGVLTRQCDGDETCLFLLMDGFLNFATAYLPQHRGGTMDAPLVLTNIINPTEVDDMVFNMDIAWSYSLEFYEAACQFKKPWDVKVPLVNDMLGTEKQYEGMGFTHDTDDFNEGVLCSAYKLLPSMQKKVDGQLGLAEKISAVDEGHVAQLVIDKHFLRDIMGNLRKFSQQEFRCVKCNTKYRRPPISGKCKNCNAPKIIFTISKGSVVKYLEMSIALGKKYNIKPYTRQCLELLKFRVDGVFGREKEKQAGLGEFF